MKIKEIILSNGKTLKGVIEENGKVYYSIQAVAKSCGFSTEQAKTLKRRLLKNKLTRELLEWGTIPTTVSGQKGWKLNSENLIYLALSVPEFSLVVIEASSNCKIYRFSHTVQELGKNPYGLIFNLLKSSFEEILNEGINAIKTKEDIENLNYEEVIKKYPEEIENMKNIIIKEIVKKMYIDPEKNHESYRLYAVKHIEKDLIFLGFCSSEVTIVKELYNQAKMLHSLENHLKRYFLLHPQHNIHQYLYYYQKHFHYFFFFPHKFLYSFVCMCYQIHYNFLYIFLDFVSQYF